MIVYIYTFPNGKKYIGQTVQTLERRARNGKGYKTSPLVYKAIQKYGWDNIQKEIFECQSEEEMDKLEKQLIKKYNTQDIRYGYNIEEGGNSGKHLSESTKAKISNTEKGKKMSEEAKQKISEAMKGEKNPRYGVHLSKETKEKLSKALSGEKHPMYGKHHSEETKKKMSENSGRAKPVVCLETGEIFPSASAASKKCGLYRTAVNVYLGKTEEYRKNHICGGYHWEWA